MNPKTLIQRLAPAGLAALLAACSSLPGPAPVVSSCRAISAELRGPGPYSREAVIAEIVRARRDGELDFSLGAVPSRTMRPICPV